MCMAGSSCGRVVEKAAGSQRKMDICAEEGDSERQSVVATAEDK